MCLELSKQTYDKRDQEEVLFDAGHGSMGIERQQLTKPWQFVLLFTHYITHLTVLVPRYLDYHMWAQKKKQFLAAAPETARLPRMSTELVSSGLLTAQLILFESFQQS